MIGDAHRLTPGYVARHLPPASCVGPDIARLDIAQDFLLADLADSGAVELVVFTGGTALRKLFAGGQSRSRPTSIWRRAPSSRPIVGS